MSSYLHFHAQKVFEPEANGATRITINVSRTGNRGRCNAYGQLVPFGSIWTWKATDERHPWHAKPLHGEYRSFASLPEAKAYFNSLTYKTSGEH